MITFLWISASRSPRATLTPGWSGIIDFVCTAVLFVQGLLVVYFDRHERRQLYLSLLLMITPYAFIYGIVIERFDGLTVWWMLLSTTFAIVFGIYARERH